MKNSQERIKRAFKLHVWSKRSIVPLFQFFQAPRMEQTLLVILFITMQIFQAPRMEQMGFTPTQLVNFFFQSPRMEQTKLHNK